MLRSRDDVVRYWWEQADACLASARRETDASALLYAVNRLYYSAFYAASALLLSKGKTFKKHSGVRVAFQREFVATGVLPAEWGKFYDRLFENRHQSDYVALVSFEREYVEGLLERCAALVDALKKLQVG